MMDPWSHFPSNGDAVKVSSRESQAQQHEIRSSTTGSVSLHVLPSLPRASRAVGAPISKRSESLLPVRGTCGMGPLSSNQDMSCGSSEPPQQPFAPESNDAPIPCRNLTEAFEEMVRVEPPDTNVEARTPATKQLDGLSDGDATKDMSEISPTGVADLGLGPPRSTATTAGSVKPVQVEADSKSPATTPTTEEIEEDALPTFLLHDKLKRELSQPLVNRVSFYCVIHDINQEAVSMASHDNSSFAKSEAPDDSEELSPLVIAVNGVPSKQKAEAATAEGSMTNTALIDEEKWLLAAIELRVDREQPIQDCPPTFSQAMGEREYENPLASLASSRTQLWKPSRSWWEAKSGKNPWIEPKSHNKRWRYLWPLIHYHKFLAKCVKKLKRNGVDVKSSVSPVAVFLREEVCAVSDHLASVSLFTSEEWMAVLVHFNGWSDPDPRAEARLRTLVSKQKLRPLADQCDIDSPLLRSQIDEQFLKAMASAREQMINGANLQERKSLKKEPSTRDGKSRSFHNTSADGKHHRKGGGSSQASPPLPQYINATTPVNGQKSRKNGGKSGQRHVPGHPNQNWNGSGWLQHPQYTYGDDTSAQSFSTMSVDGFPQQYSGQQGEYGMYHGTPGYYLPTPQQYPAVSPGPNGPECYYYPHTAGYHPDAAAYPMPDTFHAEHSGSAYAAYPPFGDPSMAYGGIQVHHQEGALQYAPPGYPSPGHGAPPSPYHFSPAHPGADPQNSQAEASKDQTPYKYTPHSGPHVPPSPYWGHINALEMAGMFTPSSSSVPPSASKASPATPVTPMRPPTGAPKTDDNNAQKEDDFSPPSVNVEFAKDAKPLLINHPSQYYHYGQQGAREGYAPPSPATQFMMSPQANSQAAAYFARNYGHNSPQRRSARNIRTMLTPVYSNVSEGHENHASVDGKDTSTVGTTNTAHVTPPPAVRKVTKKSGDRGSPATVQTAAESESIHEAA